MDGDTVRETHIDVRRCRMRRERISTSGRRGRGSGFHVPHRGKRSDHGLDAPAGRSRDEMLVAAAHVQVREERAEVEVAHGRATGHGRIGVHRCGGRGLRHGGEALVLNPHL